MTLKEDTVKQVAHLARIELEPHELEVLSSQLKDILEFIDKLKQINIEGIAPTNHILSIHNVLRQDVPGESLSTEEALKNAPLKEGSFFAVPKVIE
ncbi:MAG: Asp-tRNA(Asn)/Glu-tRNA(Gln) amidotransferase subunit GatC [Candidatus Omnitrophica bacterium]|jgi:aspartyl-tRNA(Asn)/glutamyl-tRNA(Gln) amidotransferase subunit C|nr:Asp-tRNA(Asn)/Glu-tRNA(Gln) amidotransferase subunit GatC [Candidatus Omnitrophota bacterium]